MSVVKGKTVVKRKVTGKAKADLDKKIAARKVRDKQFKFMDNQTTLSGNFRKPCKNKKSGQRFKVVTRPYTAIIPPSGKVSLNVEVLKIGLKQAAIFSEDMTRLIEIIPKAVFEKDFVLVEAKTRKVKT